jgi:S1-C subfamily serine protease
MSLETLSSLVQQAAAQAGPSLAGLGRGWGRGSGVVVAPNRLLTVAHVLRDRDRATLRFPGGRIEDGRVVGLDLDADLAVLEADTGDAPPVPLAHEDARPAIGDVVVALADPGGRGLRVTAGLVSAEPRRIRGPRGRRISGAIEHTAPLPRGASGGPLLDAGGRLLGLNAIRLDGGLIVAVPAQASQVERLSAGSAPEPARLGVAVAGPHVARRMRRAVGLPDRDGLLVRDVEEGGPAATAGVQRGDLLVSAGGRELDAVDTMYAILDAYTGTDPLKLGVVRGSDELELEVTLR